MTVSKSTCHSGSTLFVAVAWLYMQLVLICMHADKTKVVPSVPRHRATGSTRKLESHYTDQHMFEGIVKNLGHMLGKCHGPLSAP